MSFKRLFPALVTSVLGPDFETLVVKNAHEASQWLVMKPTELVCAVLDWPTPAHQSYDSAEIMAMSFMIWRFSEHASVLGDRIIMYCSISEEDLLEELECHREFVQRSQRSRGLNPSTKPPISVVIRRHSAIQHLNNWILRLAKTPVESTRT